MKNKKPFNMDERNKLIAYKVMSVMYILTIMAIQAVVIYRQFALNQSIHDFKDIAIIMTVNSLFLVTALLYFGALPIRKLKIKTLLLLYSAILVLGCIFTFLKYNVFQKADLSNIELLEKFGVIAAISGLIVLFFTVFLLLGKRKQEKEIED